MSRHTSVGTGSARPDLALRPVPRSRIVGSGGPVVVLVHGVGVGAAAFGRVARQLSAAATVVVVDRAGYGRSALHPPAWTMDDHVADLLAVIDGLPRAPVVVGVSGGATIAVAAAIEAPRAAVRFIVHEPLIGPLAPSLHAAVSRRLALLDASPGPVGAAVFVRSLVGEETWEVLGERRRREVGERSATVRAEAPSFGAFAPGADALGSVAFSLVATIGERAPAMRVEVGEVLSDLGVESRAVPGGGHLPHVEAPEAFARLIAELVEEVES